MCIGAVSVDSTGSGSVCIGAAQQPALCAQVVAHSAMTRRAACRMSMRPVDGLRRYPYSVLFGELDEAPSEMKLRVFYSARPRFFEPAKTPGKLTGKSKRRQLTNKTTPMPE